MSFGFSESGRTGEGSGRTGEAGLRSRRDVLVRGGRLGVGVGIGLGFGVGASVAGLGGWGSVWASAPDAVEVAYAGSMGSLMEGPLKSAAARTLNLAVRGRGQGASALAQLIVGGSLRPDVFVSVTPGPMELVLRAGAAATAVPVAATRMVIAWSPASRFAGQFEAARAGRTAWWSVLEEPGLRFGRTDPATDPQGRNIVFTMMLAAKKYGQPDLVEKVLGPLVNPRQISLETSVAARLQAGELDAASAYRIQPGAFHLPFLDLPPAVDLSGSEVHEKNPEVRLEIGGKTFAPEPLVFYAAALKRARNPMAAEAFVRWLTGAEAQRLFREGSYDPAGDAAALRA